MGSTAAVLLARHDDVDLLVLDVDRTRAEKVVAHIGRGEAHEIDITGGRLADDLRNSGAQTVAACIPYRLNVPVMEAALEAGCHYADLGGLFHTTLRQLDLDARFDEAGLSAVLGIGSAPGLTNVLAKRGADKLDQTHSIDLFDGAVEPGGGFALPYSADTVIDEFTMPAMVFEDGVMKEVPAASGAIRYAFPDPIGEQEAFYTLHSEAATLSKTIPGVRDVRWRLALPSKIAEGFRLLVQVGLASEEPETVAGGTVVPRELLVTLLNRLPESEEAPHDVECIDARVEGVKDGAATTVLERAMFRPTPEGLSAGSFGTAIPIATIARWQASGRVGPGVHPPEVAVPADDFLRDLEAEGVLFPPTG
jgi:saccharopine dehydrogenase (NAD+, L-lysine-forming)